MNHHFFLYKKVLLKNHEQRSKTKKFTITAFIESRLTKRICCKDWLVKNPLVTILHLEHNKV